MSETRRPLFQLDPEECQAELARLLSPLGNAFPIRRLVISASMVAEAACQRITLMALSMTTEDRLAWGEYQALRPDTSAQVEGLAALFFRPVPASAHGAVAIDLVTWDSAGYIHGWWLDDDGKPTIVPGSCPHTVGVLADILDSLASCDLQWQNYLRSFAEEIRAWLGNSIERSAVVAAERVASQGWWRRLTKPTNQQRELLSLGWGAGSAGYDTRPSAPPRGGGSIRPSALASAMADSDNQAIGKET